MNLMQMHKQSTEVAWIQHSLLDLTAHSCMEHGGYLGLVYFSSMVQTLFISTTSTDIEPGGEMSAKMQKKEVRETVLSNWKKKNWKN